MSTICQLFIINDKNTRRNALIKLLNEIQGSSSEDNLEYSAQLSFMQYVALYCVKTKNGNTKLAERILDDIHHTVYNSFDGNVTLTYGDVAESHAGMQQMGERAEKGFSYEDLMRAKVYFETKGIETKIIHLNNFLPVCEPDEDDMKEVHELGLARTDKDKQAYVLIARDGVSKLVDSPKGESLLTEVLFYHWDAHFFNVKKKAVQNKNARSNLNFSVTRQVATYENYELSCDENGKVIPAIGTNVAFSDVPILNKLRSSFAEAIGPAADNLQCEGNLYKTGTKKSNATGIGYHGDTERRKVIGCRLGNKSMNMHFMWYYNNLPRGHNISFTLNPGDLYMMSEKTVGTDWRPNREMCWYNKSYVLRHAAGAAKYTSDTTAIKLDKTFKWDKDTDISLASVNHRKKGKCWKKMPN